MITSINEFRKYLQINEITYADINLNGTDIENQIDNIIQKIYWLGGDIDKLYNEWEKLNMPKPEFDSKSIHFLNFLKGKYP